MLCAIIAFKNDQTEAIWYHLTTTWDPEINEYSSQMLINNKATLRMLYYSQFTTIVYHPGIQ